MAEPDLTDQILDFGDLWFPTGAAFLTEGTASRSPNEAKQIVVPQLTAGMEPVAKTWWAAPNKTILIEALSWQTVQPKIAALPNAAPSDFIQTANRLEGLNQLAPPNPDSGTVGIIQTAKTDYRPTGFVLDYVTVPSSYTDPVSFVTGVTYFVKLLYIS